MIIFLVLAGLVMVALGVGICSGATTVLGEIEGLLLFGFGMLTVTMGEAAYAIVKAIERKPGA